MTYYDLVFTVFTLFVLFYSLQGLNVATTLWKMSQFTTDRQLQQYIIHQLQTASALPSKNLYLVELLQNLYKAYPSSTIADCMKEKQDMLGYRFVSLHSEYLMKKECQALVNKGFKGLVGSKIFS